MLFLDGVGLGRKDGETNPFFHVPMKTLSGLLGGTMMHLRDPYRSTRTATLVPVNATLGVPGLPQSGTGQTSLLTGRNAARMIGKHFGPHPYSSLRPLIGEMNIFSRLAAMGRRTLYANAFPRQYFEYIAAKRTRTTAITMAWLASGHELNDARALASGQALSADITNERWPALGYPAMPSIPPKEAGRRLVTLAEDFDFVLYEFFYTDHAGHSQSMQQAAGVLDRIDGLLEGILGALDAGRLLLLLTSDHGNLEDLSTRSHTRNPVPLLACGKQHGRMAAVRSLTQIAPSIIDLMQ